MNFDKYINKLPAAFNISNNATYEYKLARLYAYNFYFEAMDSNIDECLEGLLGGRDNYNYVDGVYLNTTLDEDQIDIFSVFYVPENGNFNLSECMVVCSFLTETIKNARKGNYSFGTKSVEFVSKRLDEFDVEQYRVKIITNYIPKDEERNEFKRKLSNTYADNNISIELVYGDDFLQIVEENTAPFDYVNEGSLVIDSKENILKYNENSFVCNVSAKSLKELWQKEGKRGLLAMNLRYYIESKSIDLKIENSIIETPDNFWYFNNGIILVCDDFEFVDNKIELKKFSIVNGGQTTRMIGEVIFDKDFYIVCKVIKNTFNNVVEKNTFIASVAEASNTQKPIKAKDIIANRIEQRNLKSLLNENGIYIEIKRGDKCNTQLFPEVYQRTKNNELAQDLFSFIYLQPGSARNNVTKILQQQDKYDKIFVKHSYSVEFLKDLIWLEKAFIEYAKKVKKNPTTNAKKQNLVYNGKLIALGTIGFLLKNIYCLNYFNSCKQYKNHDAYKDIYYSEQDFNHKFIKDLTYKEFKEHIFDLFEYIFDNLIIPTFDNLRSANPSMVYSNFLKTDVNFKAVINTIEMLTNSYNNEIYKTVASHFIEISAEQEKENTTLYENNINAAILSKNKKENKPQDKEKNDKLYLELFTFRQNKAAELKVQEKKIFTDKQLEKFVSDKPKDNYQFAKICKGDYGKLLNAEIIQIICKYL